MAIGVFVKFNFFLFGRMIICFLSFFVLMQAVTKCGQSNVTQCHNLLTCGELNSLWFKKRRRGRVGKGEGTKRGGREVSLYYCKCQKAKAAKSQLINCDWYNNYYSVLSLENFSFFEYIQYIVFLASDNIDNINIKDISWIETNWYIPHIIIINLRLMGIDPER